MVRFVFGFIILLVAVGLLFKGKVAEGKSDEFNLRWVGGPLLILSVLLIAWSGLRTVSTGTEGVAIQFGKVKANLDPGVHWVAPWTEVKELPTRTTPYTMDSHPAEGAQVGDDSISATTSGGAQVKVDSTILYHIQSSDATGVYKNIGSRYEDIIRSTSRSDIRRIFGTYDAVDAATTKVPEISVKVESALVADLGKRGIVVEQFQLRQVELPQTITDAVQQKLAAQQQAEQATYALQKAQVDAQTAVAKAKGDSDANALRTKTLTAGVLCEDFINALAGHMPATLLTAGPCAGTTATAGNVLLNVPAGASSN